MPPGMRRLGAVHKGRAEKFFKIPDSMIESYRQEAGKRKALRYDDTISSGGTPRGSAMGVEEHR